MLKANSSCRTYVGTFTSLVCLTYIFNCSLNQSLRDIHSRLPPTLYVNFVSMNVILVPGKPSVCVCEVVRQRDVEDWSGQRLGVKICSTYKQMYFLIALTFLRLQGIDNLSTSI